MHLHQRAIFLLFVGLSAFAVQDAGSGPALGSTRLGDYIVEPEQHRKTAALTNTAAWASLRSESSIKIALSPQSRCPLS
jgi:hypothetical protein